VTKKLKSLIFEVSNVNDGNKLLGSLPTGYGSVVDVLDVK